MKNSHDLHEIGMGRVLPNGCLNPFMADYAWLFPWDAMTSGSYAGQTSLMIDRL